MLQYDRWTCDTLEELASGGTSTMLGWEKEAAVSGPSLTLQSEVVACTCSDDQAALSCGTSVTGSGYSAFTRWNPEEICAESVLTLHGLGPLSRSPKILATIS